MVVTRKRSDSALSNHDEAASSEDAPAIRRSTRLTSSTSKVSQSSAEDRSASPLVKSTRSRKVKATSESESERPSSVNDGSASPPRKLPRGRRRKNSESESEPMADSKVEEPAVESPPKRTRTASTSSTRSLDGDARRPSSRNTPLKTIVEHTVLKSSKEVESSPALRRSTRKAVSEPESDGEHVENPTPRRATRRSLKVSAEPALGVVSEEVRQSVDNKAVVEELDSGTVSSVAKSKDESTSGIIAEKKVEEVKSSLGTRRSTRKTANEPDSDGEHLDIPTPRRATRHALKVSAEPLLGVVSEEVRQAVDNKMISQEISEEEPASATELKEDIKRTSDSTEKKVEESISAKLVPEVATEETGQVVVEAIGEGERLSATELKEDIERTSDDSEKNVEESLPEELVPEVATEERGQAIDKKAEIEEVDEETFLSGKETKDSVIGASDDLDGQNINNSSNLELASNQADISKNTVVNQVSLGTECKASLETVDVLSDTSKHGNEVEDMMQIDSDVVVTTESVSNVEVRNEEEAVQMAGAVGEEMDKGVVEKVLDSPQKNDDDFVLAVPDSPVRVSASVAKSSDADENKVAPPRHAPIVIPRGKNVSGRFWRDPKERFKNNFKDKGLKSTKEQYEKLRMERMRVKLLEEKVKEERRQKIEDLRKRQQLKGQRKEINDRRGEVVQVIKNTAKLKTLSKKQKRLIQKRDTTNMVKA